MILTNKTIQFKTKENYAVLSKHRFEFFSDGMMAIIMTIMVLEIPIPKPFSIEGFKELLISLMIFFVSFFIVAGFLNKHHHLVDGIKQITNKIVWRNFVFLFFIALLPVFTKLIIENNENNFAIIIYDIVFIFANISLYILAHEGRKQIPPEELKKIISLRKNRFGNKFAYLKIVIACIMFIGMVLLSLIIPKFSIIMFLVFPLIFNLLNIFLDNNVSPITKEIQKIKEL
jgi:uncharacterized membrane protein